MFLDVVRGRGRGGDSRLPPFSLFPMSFTFYFFFLFFPSSFLHFPLQMIVDAIYNEISLSPPYLPSCMFSFFFLFPSSFQISLPLRPSLPAFPFRPREGILSHLV